MLNLEGDLAKAPKFPRKLVLNKEILKKLERVPSIDGDDLEVDDLGCSSMSTVGC